MFFTCIMPKISKLWFKGYDGLINEQKTLEQQDLVVSDCVNQDSFNILIKGPFIFVK